MEIILSLMVKKKLTKMSYNFLTNANDNLGKKECERDLDLDISYISTDPILL